MSDPKPSGDNGLCPISAIIISYNREALIRSVLQAVQFCDEVILVDKSSTDATRDMAAGLYDKLVQMPWTPTADDTRSEAIKLASHEWVIMLDDDEILNEQASAWIKNEIKAPRARVYGLPLRHYIIGVFDPNAYYWPESHTRFFHKDDVTFAGKIHGGFSTDMNKVFWVDAESGVAIEHLSHPSVATWIEKTNRYTSCADRNHPEIEMPYAPDILAFAKQRIDFWEHRSRVRFPGDYPQMAAMLRALYDIIDRLKVWEEERGIDGTALFQMRADELMAAHVQEGGGQNPPRRGTYVDATGAANPTQPPGSTMAIPDPSDIAALGRQLDQTRAKLRYLEYENRFYRSSYMHALAAPLETFNAKRKIWIDAAKQTPALRRLSAVRAMVRQGTFRTHLQGYVARRLGRR